MNKTVQMIVGVIVVAIIVVGAYFAYIWVAGGDGEPSTDIADAVPTLQVDDSTEEEATEEADTEEMAEEEATEEADTEEMAEEATEEADTEEMAEEEATEEADTEEMAEEEATEEADTEEMAEEEATEEADTEEMAEEEATEEADTEEMVEEEATEEADTEEMAEEEATEEADTEAQAVEEEVKILFNIDAENSEAKFELDEDLRGNRITATGTTNQVGGQILINFDNPQDSQVGVIRINARTLETDQAFRNRALRADILKSSQDEFEFIDFEPTELNGLPESVEMGETYEFEIVGNLTIVGETHEVTFTASVTLESETQISGTASGTVLRSDYGINIPSVPQVANVEDEVELTLTFVAVVGE